VHIVQRVYGIVNTKTSEPIVFVETIDSRAEIPLSRKAARQLRNHPGPAASPSAGDAHPHLPTTILTAHQPAPKL
jgi:hypothetical protein